MKPGVYIAQLLCPARHCVLGDHNHFGHGPPLLFETMIFTDGEPENYQERSSTWLEAEQQHHRAVEGVTARVNGRSRLA